ncbi:MAG: SurA N-terminal domain-containing protein, partial [Xanthomonadales bacterium]|nr:SurA N-terminal domain-containing protein [Xanthomonadales bacterium]
MSLIQFRAARAPVPLIAALLLTLAAVPVFAQDVPPADAPPADAPAADAPPEPAGEPIDEIVAIVEEDVILKSELDLAVEGIQERIRAQGAAMPSEDLLRRQVLERLIMRKLQVQNALRTGIRVSDTDIDQALVGLAQQNQITLAEMRSVIESEGEDFSEFRQSVGEELITERLRQRVVGGMSQISETEVDILLASQDFAGGEYNVSHILVAVPEGATPAQLEEAA